MDIKNAFSHVGVAQFARVYMNIGLAQILIRWFVSFINNRSMRFAFDGEIGLSISVNSGIPQRSPVSPIMFLIYIHHIFKAFKRWPDITALSFIDDVGITTESFSAEANDRRLQKVLKALSEVASKSQIEFNTDKTEFIHFYNRRQPIDDRLNFTFITVTGPKVVEVPSQE